MNDLTGLHVVADPSLQQKERGTVLIGGSPLRVVRISDKGADLLDALLAGEPVPSSANAQRLVRRLLDSGLLQPSPHSTPFTYTDVTVVIPVHGEMEPGLLDGLGPVHRIVVVDDASSVPVTTPAQTAHGVVVDVVRRDRNGGPAAARNTGLAEVTTTLVAFVDADCLPRLGWLTPLLDQFADSAVAAVAPRIVAVEPLSRAEYRNLAAYERTHASLDLGPQRGRVRARTRLSYVPSAVLVCRVATARELEGFDESMKIGEDVDFVWRLDEHNYTVRYEPTSTVGHRHRTTPWAWAKRRFDYGTSAGPLARRHPGALVPLEASGWSVATWGLVAAGHPFAAGAVVGATAGMLSGKLGELDRPLPVAAQLATRGHLSAGRLLAQSLVRPWWPLTFAAFFFIPSRRLRLTIACTVIAVPLYDWLRRRPEISPIPYVALRLAEDIAYSTGVWVGSLRARSFEPLVPDLTSWPKPSRYSRWRAERLGTSSNEPIAEE